MDGLLITGQSGLVTGTRVASNLGWRAVEALSVGDMVLTFDNGMQTVIDIQREKIAIPAHLHSKNHLPVFVPKGALANRKDLWLMPEQGLLIESESASDALGDPYAVVPAGALDGFRSISRRAPADQVRVTNLSFASDQVIYVEGGMLAHCPRPRCILTDVPREDDILYNVLDGPDARFLVECLIDSHQTRAFSYRPEEVASVA